MVITTHYYLKINGSKSQLEIYDTHYFGTTRKLKKYYPDLSPIPNNNLVLLSKNCSKFLESRKVKTVSLEIVCPSNDVSTFLIIFKKMLSDLNIKITYITPI